jgi:hypothetical protein
MTDEVLAKLEVAFKMGATDVMACQYANIHVTTLNRHEQSHPDFAKNVELWKKNPSMKALITVYGSLNLPDMARWWLERKEKDEFSPRAEVTGKDGKDLLPKVINNLETDYDKLTKNIESLNKPKGQTVETNPSL